MLTKNRTESNGIARGASYLIREGMERKTETVDRVAVEFDDVTIALPKPSRHHDVIRLHVELTGHRGSGRQGFVTSEGRFVVREQAALLAFGAGQTRTRRIRLYSEDLW